MKCIPQLNICHALILYYLNSVLNTEFFPFISICHFYYTTSRQALLRYLAAQLLQDLGNWPKFLSKFGFQCLTKFVSHLSPAKQVLRLKTIVLKMRDWKTSSESFEFWKLFFKFWNFIQELFLFQTWLEWNSLGIIQLPQTIFPFSSVILCLTDHTTFSFSSKWNTDLTETNILPWIIPEAKLTIHD